MQGSFFNQDHYIACYILFHPRMCTEIRINNGTRLRYKPLRFVLIEMRITRYLHCQRNNVKAVIRQIYMQGPVYGFIQSSQYVPNKSKTVVVEYSSPNIAKPFHTGHLRSTILGNFVANLYESLGWNVIRLNYLGDWGTQFGLLLTGFKKYGCETALAADPLQHLFEVYVKINDDVDTEKSQNGISRTFQDGLAAFQKMEEGDEEYLQQWRKFREISLTEFSKVYKRLGVHFTENHFESMYAKSSAEFVDLLAKDGKLKTDSGGRKDITLQHPELDQEKDLILQKSDGTSLYVTRDIVAIMDRYEKYKFDKIHYVVDDSQKTHFQNISEVMEKLPGWTNKLNQDIHIRFGRINGMSTRKGRVVFLSEILDRAKQICKTTLQKKESTKVTEEHKEDVAEELGRSSVIVQDFNKQRLRNYQFTWDKLLYFDRNSGVFMHYCHSRLYNLEANSGIEIDESLDFKPEIILNIEEASRLITELERYPKGIDLAAVTLEPHHIVKYILNICHAANQAYRLCNVNNAEPEVAQAYLHMFRASRLVIADGMRLMGLNPMKKM